MSLFKHKNIVLQTSSDTSAQIAWEVCIALRSLQGFWKLTEVSVGQGEPADKKNGTAQMHSICAAV